jgi:hypothetical protein
VADRRASKIQIRHAVRTCSGQGDEGQYSMSAVNPAGSAGRQSAGLEEGGVTLKEQITLT